MSVHEKIFSCSPVPPSFSSQRQPVLHVLGCPQRAVSAFIHHLLVLAYEHVSIHGCKLLAERFVFCIFLITYIFPLILHRPYSYFEIIEIKISKGNLNLLYFSIIEMLMVEYSDSPEV